MSAIKQGIVSKDGASIEVEVDAIEVLTEKVKKKIKQWTKSKGGLIVKSTVVQPTDMTGWTESYITKTETITTEKPIKEKVTLTFLKSPKESEVYQIRKGAKEVGVAVLSKSKDGNSYHVFNVHLDKEYRSRGVANAFYDFIEKDLNTTITRDKGLYSAISDDGRRMWDRRNERKKNTDIPSVSDSDEQKEVNEILKEGVEKYKSLLATEYNKGEIVYLKEDFEGIIKRGELVEVLQDVSYQPGGKIFTTVKTQDGREALLNITWLTRKQPKVYTMNVYDELKNIIERKAGKGLFEMNEGEFEKYVGDATTFKNGVLIITESQSEISVFGRPSLKSTAIGTMYQAMLVKYAKEVPEYMLTLEQYATIEFIKSAMMEFSVMGGLAVFEESYRKEYDKMLEMNGKKEIPVTPSVPEPKDPLYPKGNIYIRDDNAIVVVNNHIYSSVNNEYVVELTPINEDDFAISMLESEFKKALDRGTYKISDNINLQTSPSVSEPKKETQYIHVGDEAVQFTDKTFRWDIPKIEDIEKEGYVFSNMVTSNFYPYNTQRIAFEIDYKQSDLHFHYIGNDNIGVFIKKDAVKGYVSEAMLPGGKKDVKISTPSVSSTQKPKNVTEQRHYIINAMFDRYRKGLKSNKTDIVRITTEAGVEDLNWAYEIVELSWVEWYRHMITRAKDAGKSIDEIMKEVWRFYEIQQPAFTAMDSTKRIYQQYSTAAIISLLGGWFVDNGKAYKNMSVFEPSAGNGLLTIWFKREACWVNELDKTRNGNLALGIPLDLDKPNTLVHYNDVKNFDASNDLVFAHFDDIFDGVLTNPPFGPLIKSDLRIKDIQVKLDEKMAQVALQTMKYNGRAAIVVGEHTEFTTEGVIRGRRPFYHWLYKNFNVVDMVNIDSQKLYQKQGTIYPLRLILIAGKKEKAFGRAPFQKEQPQLSEIVQTPEELLARVAKAKEKALVPMVTLNDLIKLEIKKLEIALK